MRSEEKYKRRVRRHGKIKAKLFSSDRPRLSVFRSNKFIYGQIIDDDRNETLVSFSTAKLSEKKMTDLEKAKEAGRSLAEEAKKKKISKVVFDRGGFAYKGKIKAFAEGSREGGLEF